MIILFAVFATVAYSAAISGNANGSGAQQVLLNYDDYVVFGPLTTPAALTLTGLKLVSSTGTFSGGAQPAGFDVFLFDQATYAQYSNPSDTTQFAPDLTYSISETRITGAYSNSKTDFVLSGAPKTWYIVFDNRARGGRTPDNGATVTISWTDFNWKTGSDVQVLPSNSYCGTRTVYSGTGQYAYFPFTSIGNGQSVSASFSADNSCTASAKGYIFSQQQFNDFKSGGAFSISSQCSSGAVCQTTTTASLPFVFVVTGSSAGCAVSYRVLGAATTTGTTGCSTTTTTTAATPTTTAAPVATQPPATTTTAAPQTTTAPQTAAPTTTTTAAATTAAPMILIGGVSLPACRFNPAGGACGCLTNAGCRTSGANGAFAYKKIGVQSNGVWQYQGYCQDAAGADGCFSLSDQSTIFRTGLNGPGDVKGFCIPNMPAACCPGEEFGGCSTTGTTANPPTASSPPTQPPAATTAATVAPSQAAGVCNVFKNNCQQCTTKASHPTITCRFCTNSNDCVGPSEFCPSGANTVVGEGGFCPIVEATAANGPTTAPPAAGGPTTVAPPTADNPCAIFNGDCKSCTTRSLHPQFSCRYCTGSSNACIGPSLTCPTVGTVVVGEGGFCPIVETTLAATVAAPTSGGNQIPQTIPPGVEYKTYTCDDCSDYGTLGSLKWCGCCEGCVKNQPYCRSMGWCNGQCTGLGPCSGSVNTNAPSPAPMQPSQAPSTPSPSLGQGPSSYPGSLNCDECNGRDLTVPGSSDFCRCCDGCAKYQPTCRNQGWCKTQCTGADSSCPAGKPFSSAGSTVAPAPAYAPIACSVCETGFGAVGGATWCKCCNQNCGNYQDDCVNQNRFCFTKCNDAPSCPAIRADPRFKKYLSEMEGTVTGSSNTVGIIVGVFFGVVVILGIVGLVIFVVKYRDRKRREAEAEAIARKNREHQQQEALEEGRKTSSRRRSSRRLDGQGSKRTSSRRKLEEVTVNADEEQS